MSGGTSGLVRVADELHGRTENGGSRAQVCEITSRAIAAHRAAGNARVAAAGAGAGRLFASREGAARSSG